MDIVERFVAARAHRLAGEGGSFPLERCFYRVGGRQVFARINETKRGEEPVVFVHGMGISGLYMVPTAVQVARLHPVYIPDLPGLGNSDSPGSPLNLDEFADTLAGFVRAAGLRRATLVGNSYGCQIIARCAVRHPGAAGRVVLQAPTMDAAARSSFAQIWRWLVNALFEPVSEGPVILRDYSKAGLRELRFALREALAHPIEDDLRQLRIPALVVRGANDPIVPEAWAREVTQIIPDAQFLTIARAAHTVNYAAPGRFAEAIVGFMRRGQP